jgi:GNAT superfamily N-acetyltransferase
MAELTVARPGDAEAIAVVKTTGWRSTYAEHLPPPVLEELMDDERVVAELEAALSDERNVAIVARTDGSVVGFAMCMVAGRDDPFLDSMHVLPAERGGGIGSAMLRFLADELARRGHSTLTTTVVEQNTRSRRLYERFGAVHVGTKPASWAPEHAYEAHYRWDDLEPLREPG